MDDLVNFGIVGLGHIGLRHAKHVVENKRALLKSVCDILPIENSDISTNKIAFHSNYLDYTQFGEGWGLRSELGLNN